VFTCNDCGAITRSNEAKEVGHWHERSAVPGQARFADADIMSLSANFSLYGNINNRMMSLAASR